MTVLVIVGGLALLCFPGWLDTRRNFGPARLAQVARASMMIGLVGIVLGLAMWGAPALLHWADALGVPGLCDAAVHRLPLGGLELAIAMAAIALGVSGRAVAAVKRARQRAELARVDPFFGRHQRLGRYDVVVVPSAQLVALGVPGERPQIVLTEGLVAELTSAEVEAVIRHEAAHHRLRHRQYLLTATVVDQIFGWLPPVRASVVSLRNVLEEWADIESTERSDSRIAALCSALERLAARRTTTVDRRAIDRRLASLAACRRPSWSDRPRRLGAWVPAATLALVGSVTVALTLQITHAVVRCQV